MTVENSTSYLILLCYLQDLEDERTLAYARGAHYLVDDTKIAPTKLINFA